MKAISNIPFPPYQKWKGDQVIVYYNITFDGENYEADYTIAENNSDEAILSAIKRALHAVEIDNSVSQNFEIDGKEAITVIPDYAKDLPEILKSEIVLDNDLNKSAEVITSEVAPVDEVIKKVAGGVRNYVIEATAGKRTTETDLDVQKLIEDNNIVITYEEGNK